MKHTPLTQIHIELGAKMADFAGYNMPISYAGINEEHKNVRAKVGVFDVSHMGEFIIKGKEAFDLIQKVTSNDVAKLEIGDIQYSCLPNGKGGIVDDLLVYRLDENDCSDGERAYMLVVNASNIDKDWNWIESQNDFEARMINISSQTGILAIQGPLAVKTLQSLTDLDLENMKYYTFQKGQLAGFDNILISATGYTGSGGFEVYAENEKMVDIWKAIFKAGREYGIMPIGLGARDTLRLEMGYCLYGNDINDETSPIEAGLGWITKTKKGDFIDRDLFIKQRKEGVDKKLVAFTLEGGRRVPRHDYKILNAAGEEIGVVTSGTMSPSVEIPIGMGYVDVKYATVGGEVFISFGKKQLPATIVKLPFYKIG